MASIHSIIVEENQYQVTDAMVQIAATNLIRIHNELVCELLKKWLPEEDSERPCSQKVVVLSGHPEFR